MPIEERAAPIFPGESTGRHRFARGDYDFATLGGAVGPIVLAAGVIPQGALILSCDLEIDTVPTSGGAATISVDTEAAGDMQAAAAIAGAPWSTLGPKIATQSRTTAAKKTTAKRDIAVTVGAAALTAGKFKVIVAYIEAP